MIAQFIPRIETPASLTPEQSFSLRRLSRLVNLAPSPSAPFDAEQLLRHAIFSMYVDCREHCVEAAAREILAEATHRQVA